MKTQKAEEHIIELIQARNEKEHKITNSIIEAVRQGIMQAFPDCQQRYGKGPKIIIHNVLTEGNFIPQEFPSYTGISINMTVDLLFDRRDRTGKGKR